MSGDAIRWIERATDGVRRLLDGGLNAAQLQLEAGARRS